jgi:hypothetical protein
MAIKALLAQFIIQATFGLFKWIDSMFAAWLTRRHLFWLLAILASVVGLDIAIATGASIPILGTILSSADGILLLVDEALMIWPVARVAIELLRRAKMSMIAKGIAVPKALEKIEVEVERSAVAVRDRAERDARQALVTSAASK